MDEELCFCEFEQRKLFSGSAIHQIVVNCHLPQIVKNDIRLAAKIVQNYDKRHNLFQVEEAAENGKKNGSTNGEWPSGVVLSPSIVQYRFIMAWYKRSSQSTNLRPGKLSRRPV